MTGNGGPQRSPFRILDGSPRQTGRGGRQTGARFAPGGTMPATIYYESDATLAPLQDKTIAVIGYGSQGHAHALNLRDSGLNVIVGLHEGSKSRAKAESDGLTVMSVADAAKAADVIMIVIPDQTQARVYKEEIEPNLTSDKTLMFAHGFNIN